MNLVGKLGATAGMGDVREHADIMEQARPLGIGLREALGRG